MNTEAVKNVLAALERENVRYVVFGPVALNLLGLPRTTEQYVPPEGTFHVDILTKLGEAFRYEDIRSQRIAFLELMANVTTPEMLYKMKKDTVRPKDRGDADLLRRRFNIEEK